MKIYCLRYQNENKAISLELKEYEIIKETAKKYHIKRMFFTEKLDKININKMNLEHRIYFFNINKLKEFSKKLINHKTKNNNNQIIILNDRISEAKEIEQDLKMVNDNIENYIVKNN